MWFEVDKGLDHLEESQNYGVIIKGCIFSKYNY